MAGVICELRCKTGEASKSINGTGVNNGAGAQVKELALAASTLYKCSCVSSTAWFVTKVPATGAPAGGGTPNQTYRYSVIFLVSLQIYELFIML